MALVFGQTIVNGKNEGANGVLVPIRDDNLNILPGVTIVDMGWKQGMNGVDNGMLRFNKVRVPRVNMMNRFTDVDEKGEFHCDIEKRYSRFFKVTERLLSGRMCLASMSMGCTRACLYVAIKYYQTRMGAGISGKSDTPIFNYQLQQNAVIPLLARSLCLNHLHNKIKRIFANQKGYECDVT